MKKILFTFIVVSAVLPFFAQTTNYAIKNGSGIGYAQTISLAELNNATETTVQFWINPTEKGNNASIFSQENLKIIFVDGGKMAVSDGINTALVAAAIPLNQWTHITIVYQNGNVQVYANNQAQSVTGSLATQLSSTSATCRIAEGMKGQIDELRVWNKALEQENFFWRNTLNKFHPDYDKLIAYWKFDQNQCKDIVDYQLRYHAALHNLERVVVNDNTQFAYRVVTGYTNFLRFLDRGNINRNMFLMTNDLILLSLKVQNDGSLFPEYPDNSGVPEKVSYLETFNGRAGVMNFEGTGAKMTAKSSHAPFKPNTQFANAETNSASFAGWFYIENWTEGAKLLSKYKDDANCIEITLGSEANKSIIVNVNGMKGVLKNKLALKKWQYIGVYISPTPGKPSNIFVNPITIGIDFKNHDRFSGVALSGSSLTISTVPILADVPMILGENFDGKMDEVMLWGSNRKGSAQNDANNPYQWNIGNWNNIFLNAYWKGDDPDNIGRDSHSYLAMIDFIRDYYKNHRGMKIRFGIIYPDGNRWQQMFTDSEKLNRFIADAKKFLSDADGFDLDLEWSYNQWQYDILNNVIRRLLNEVMAGHRDTKTFTVSLHEVSYRIDKALIPDIDYFTFQLYGPHAITYTWDWYVSAYYKFMNYGFPKDKTLLSYGILLVNNGEEGYKDLFEKYGMNDQDYNPDLNQWNCGGTTKYFNGVTQTKRKQNFIIDKDVRGTMYFDMGNDQKVSDYKSLIRAQNDIVAANVDTLITAVKVPTSIKEIADFEHGLFFSIYRKPLSGKLEINVTPEILSRKPTYSIYHSDGKLIKQNLLVAAKTSVEIQHFAKGVYIITVSKDSVSHSLKFIK